MNLRASVGLGGGREIVFRQPVPQPNRITKVESKNIKLINELSARTKVDSSTNAEVYSFTPANAKPNVVVRSTLMSKLSFQR